MRTLNGIPDCQECIWLQTTRWSQTSCGNEHASGLWACLFQILMTSLQKLTIFSQPISLTWAAANLAMATSSMMVAPFLISATLYFIQKHLTLWCLTGRGVGWSAPVHASNQESRIRRRDVLLVFSVIRDSLYDSAVPTNLIKIPQTHDKFQQATTMDRMEHPYLECIAFKL